MTEKWEYNLSLSKEGIFEGLIDIAEEYSLKKIYPKDEEIKNIVTYAFKEEGSKIGISATKERKENREIVEKVIIVGSDYKKDKSSLIKIIEAIK